MSRKFKMPDPSTADRIVYVKPDDKDFVARIVRAQGWYSYTDMNTGEQVLALPR